MGTTFGRIRRAVFMAVAWALAWAPLAVVISLIVDPDESMDEPWILVGAYPGFLSAVVFSALLAMTDGRRRFDEMPLARAAALGAVSGLLVIVLPFTALLGTPNTEHLFWRGRFVIMGAVTLLSSLSAVASVMLARLAAERRAALL